MRIVVVVLCFMVLGQSISQAEPPRLIVRGDDMGFSHSGNLALMECYQQGIETTIEVIVPSPWFPEAVKMLAANPRVDVGVHLALTSEWDNVKWRPLSNALSLRDSDGYFFPMIHANKNYPDRALKEHAWRIEDIEQEFRAQIKLAKQHIPQISHLSGHMGCDHFDDRVKQLTKRLAKEFDIDIDLESLDVKRLKWDGPRETAEEKVESFIKMLADLEDGQTYLFVEHPGLDTPELRAIHHVGYENVASDRQGVTDLWTDQRVKRHIKNLGIKLIAYRDLRNE